MPRAWRVPPERKGPRPKRFRLGRGPAWPSCFRSLGRVGVEHFRALLPSQSRQPQTTHESINLDRHGLYPSDQLENDRSVRSLPLLPNPHPRPDLAMLPLAEIFQKRPVPLTQLEKPLATIFEIHRQHKTSLNGQSLRARNTTIETAPTRTKITRHKMRVPPRKRASDGDDLGAIRRLDETQPLRIRKRTLSVEGLLFPLHFAMRAIEVRALIHLKAPFQPRCQEARAIPRPRFEAVAIAFDDRPSFSWPTPPIVATIADRLASSPPAFAGSAVDARPER